MPTAPFRYKKLGYLALNVTDLSKSVAFYRDVVGMELMEHQNGKFASFRCSDNHHDLLLYPHTTPGVKYIGFEVESDEDFGAAAKYLRELGVAYTETSAIETERLMQRKGLRFKVPGCAVTLELYSGGAMGATPFKPTIAGILRLGHVVLKINHFEESFKWLTEKFGFEISDHIKGEEAEIAFLRCWPSPYHHSLGVARADINQLHHFALMVEDIDDIGRGNNRLPRSGSKVVYGPGRHVASGSIFLYFVDPDGMTVEYTYGMEEFSEDAPRQARLLPPTLETADYWGGVPAPGSFEVGLLEGAAPNNASTRKVDPVTARLY